MHLSLVFCVTLLVFTCEHAAAEYNAKELYDTTMMGRKAIQMSAILTIDKWISRRANFGHECININRADETRRHGFQEHLPVFSHEEHPFQAMYYVDSEYWQVIKDHYGSDELGFTIGGPKGFSEHELAQIDPDKPFAFSICWGPSSHQQQQEGGDH